MYIVQHKLYKTCTRTVLIQNGSRKLRMCSQALRLRNPIKTGNNLGSLWCIKIQEHTGINNKNLEMEIGWHTLQVANQNKKWAGLNKKKGQTCQNMGMNLYKIPSTQDGKTEPRTWDSVTWRAMFPFSLFEMAPFQWEHSYICSVAKFSEFIGCITL